MPTLCKALPELIHPLVPDFLDWHFEIVAIKSDAYKKAYPLMDSKAFLDAANETAKICQEQLLRLMYVCNANEGTLLQPTGLTLPATQEAIHIDMP